MNLIPPTFYDTIPSGEIEIRKMEQLTIKRYKLLNEIELHYKNNETIRKGFNINRYCSDFDWSTPEGVLNDVSSHWFLSYCYCRYDSDRNWFCKQESRLFQERLKSGRFNIPETVKAMGIPLNIVNWDNYNFATEEDKISFKNKIKFNTTAPTNINHSSNKISKDEDTFYYVDFELALSLVQSKRYFLHWGNIYIPEHEVISLLETILTNKMQKTLSKIKLHYRDLNSDARVNKIITIFERVREEELRKDLSNQADNTLSENKLSTMKDIETKYTSTFPLCMQLIHQHITKEAHLMHLGRLQYTLFLKGCGLPCDESWRYFKKKFERKTPLDKFEKQYAYNIKHSYGMEGNKVGYSPYSCIKIQKFDPAKGQECHGCPFSNMSEENLSKILYRAGLKDIDVLKIMEKKKIGEYSLACAKFFEAKYPEAGYEKVGIHPNSYFNSATKVLAKKVKIEYEKKGEGQK